MTAADRYRIPIVRVFDAPGTWCSAPGPGPRRSAPGSPRRARGEFRWDIPDLEVVVRDDIAVTWGLNRMRVQEPGEEAVESWSRGTRVFQKVDGRWLLIHQHVSFPFDPETGRITTDG